MLTPLKVSYKDALSKLKAETIPENLAPFVIALLLERAGCDWATIFGWSKYLFSDGLDSFQAQQDKEAYMKKVEHDLKKLVEQTVQAERKHHEVDNKRMLPYRVVVTNISADAGEQELAGVFDLYGM